MNDIEDGTLRPKKLSGVSRGLQRVVLSIDIWF